MAKRVPPATPKRMVWRISEAAPLGEFVDPDIQARAAPSGDVLPEMAASGGWIVSSFELLNGIDVTESGETVPDDVFDELFTPTPKAPPSSTGSK